MTSRWARVLGVLALAGAAGAGALAYRRAPMPTASPILGMVPHTELRIAPEIAGRLASLPVHPGQQVRQGDVLAVLDSPELTASVGEARAAAVGARAERDRIRSGTRPEEVAIAARAVQTAEANLTLAQQKQTRIAALSAKSVASLQQLDESSASLAKAQGELALWLIGSVSGSAST